MKETVKYEGYTFEKLQGDKNRPYKVKCYETMEEKNSSISYEDAMNLLISNIEFGEKVLEMKSADKKHIESIFIDALLDKKLSEINEIVQNDISGKKVVGTIMCMSRDKFAKAQVYFTDKFKITALCERGNLRRITNIIVEEKS